VAGSIEPSTDRNQDAAAIQSGLLSAEKKVFGGLKSGLGRFFCKICNDFAKILQGKKCV
jgi:hypothetical protein